MLVRLHRKKNKTLEERIVHNMDKALKKYAQSRGYTITDKYAYGMEDGVHTLIRQDGKAVTITLNMKSETEAAQMPIQMALNNAGFNMVAVYQQSNRIVLNTSTDNGVLKRAENLYAIINMAITTARNNGAEINDRCSVCGVQTNQVSLYQDYITNLCPQCSANIQIGSMDNLNDGSGNYLSGMLGALIGALIGSIPWMILQIAGWFIGWLAFLIGLASFQGYKMLKGPKKKGFAMFCTIFFSVAVILAQNVITPLIYLSFDGYPISFSMFIWVIYFVFTEGIVDVAFSLIIGIAGLIGIGRRIDGYIVDNAPVIIHSDNQAKY